MNKTLKIESDENGNVIAITELNQENKLTKVQLTEKTSSIKVEIETAEAQDTTYKYYYKTENGEYKQAYEGKDLTYTIERLEKGTEYWIKVEAINENGIVSKELLGKTKQLVEGQGGVIRTEIEAYNENFESIKAGVMMGIFEGNPVTEEVFIEEVKTSGIVTEENIMRNSDGNYEMITKEGYVYEMVFVSATDISVNYIGKMKD